MRAASFSETRTRVGVTVTPSEHFFFDGKCYLRRYPWRIVRQGNFSDDGAMRGTVKVTVMVNGRISLKSMGKGGNGLLLHMSPETKVVVDGVTHTLDSLVRETILNEQISRLFSALTD